MGEVEGQKDHVPEEILQGKRGVLARCGQWIEAEIQRECSELAIVLAADCVGNLISSPTMQKLRGAKAPKKCKNIQQLVFAGRHRPNY